MVLTFRLVKSTTPEVVGNNHICHRVENKLNVLCISGTGHVTVYLLRRWLVLRLKLGLDVRSSLPVFLCAWEKEKSLIIEWRKDKHELYLISVDNVFRHNFIECHNYFGTLPLKEMRRQMCKYRYLHILWSRLWEAIWGFSPQRDPSCWGTRWWRCLRTTCCCRWSRTILNFLAFGSEREEMHFFSSF